MLTTYTYDRANRLKLANAGGALTTYTVDAAGNRTSMQTPTETTYYTWDAPGRMVTADVTAGTVTFTYNADGQRTAKQSTDASWGWARKRDAVRRGRDGRAKGAHRSRLDRRSVALGSRSGTSRGCLRCTTISTSARPTSGVNRSGPSRGGCGIRRRPFAR
jgi:YD repeat-containing protein